MDFRENSKICVVESRLTKRQTNKMRSSFQQQGDIAVSVGVLFVSVTLGYVLNGLKNSRELNFMRVK